MKKEKNESASLEVIITLLFLYFVGSLVTIFGYTKLAQGYRGELSFKTLLISILAVCLILGFSFVTGFLKKKTAFYGIGAAILLNLTILPIAIYTAPVHALAVYASERVGLHYIGGYVLYAAMQFLMFGLGYVLSKLPRPSLARAKGFST